MISRFTGHIQQDRCILDQTFFKSLSIFKLKSHQRVLFNRIKIGIKNKDLENLEKFRN